MENKENMPQEQQNEMLVLQKSEASLKVAQNLFLASAILCPVSLFLPGGIFFSIAGIVCAAIGLNKILKLSKVNQAFGSKLKHIRTVAFISLSLNIVAFILNATAIWIMYPIVLNALETGDFSSLGIDPSALGISSGGSSGGNPSGGSAWG